MCSEQARTWHWPRLLSGDGPAYLSSELREYLGDRKMAHTRGAAYHPQTQGRIKRRTMEQRKKEYLAAKAAQVETRNRLLAMSVRGPESFDDLHG